MFLLIDGFEQYKKIKGRQSIHNNVPKGLSPPKTSTPNSPHTKRRRESNDELMSDYNSDNEEYYEQCTTKITLKSTKYYGSGDNRARIINRSQQERSFNSDSSKNRSQNSSYNSSGNESVLFSSNPLIYIIAGVSLLIAIWLGFCQTPAKQLANVECLQFKELSKQFPHQNSDLWKALKVSTENVINGLPPRPAVFLIAHNSIQTSNVILPKILNATASCMQVQNPISLNGGSLASPEMQKDYGEFIAMYEGLLKREKILFISDVNRIPSTTAEAFHTICDTVTPLVEQSIIIFTMKIDQFDDRTMEYDSLSKMVETELRENWKYVKANALQALITRVTDQIIWLRSEIKN